MPEKNTPDASNESEVNAIKEKSKSAVETFADDMEWLMNNPRGRRMVHGYLERCHIHETSFSTNLSQTNFAEGERNIGLQILKDVMKHTPNKYMRMIEENTK